MKNLIVILGLSFLISPSALAYDYYIRGNKTCSAFIGMAQDNPDELNRYVYWLGGYLSGYNYQKNTNTGEGVNIACIADGVIAFCKLNNSQTLGDAMTLVIEELENPKSKLNTITGCEL